MGLRSRCFVGMSPFYQVIRAFASAVERSINGWELVVGLSRRTVDIGSRGDLATDLWWRARSGTHVGIRIVAKDVCLTTKRQLFTVIDERCAT